MTARTINQFTDAELAALVRDSIYVQHTAFGDGPNESRFFFVLAAPYGHPDTVRPADPQPIVVVT